MILPAFLNIKVAPFQSLHFLGKTRTAGPDGVIRDVPYDAAKIMIDDPQHPAKEHVETAATPDPEPTPAKPPALVEPAPAPAKQSGKASPKTAD